ncbi:MAG: hypothetical protein KME16_15670 [Scytolyngbya sp. HA4215-MV1]|jgi:hypothetical protein|nr:hypothetical protein [Scytolyngbya sp. HA4215-MV1]
MKLRSLTVALSFSLLAVQLVAPIASAKERWITLGEDDGFRYSVDTSSLQRKGSFAWYWVHLVSVKSEPKSVQMLMYVSTDCRNGSSRLRQLTLFDEKGKPVDSQEPGDAGPLSNNLPPPLIRYVCRQR